MFKKFALITFFSLALSACTAQLIQALTTGVQVGIATYKALDKDEVIVVTPTPTPSGPLDPEVYDEGEGV